MWLSNLGKFRRVLVFDAEKIVFLQSFRELEGGKKVFSCSHKKQHIPFSNSVKLCNFIYSVQVAKICQPQFLRLFISHPN